MIERFALSPEGYRKVRKGVQKRIVRHMQQLRCPSIKSYLERLDNDGAVEREARRLMDVSISRFFRDGPLWQMLGEEILPSFIAEHPGGGAGLVGGLCPGAGGLQPPDSLGPPGGKHTSMPPLELWATDVNPAYQERAIEGIYPAGALTRVPEEAMVRFFRPAGKANYRVADELREGIRWKLHDLTVDAPPERDFHIIFLRNNLPTTTGTKSSRGPFRPLWAAWCRAVISSSAGRSNYPIPERLPYSPGGVPPVPEAGIKRDGVMGRSKKLSS